MSDSLRFRMMILVATSLLASSLGAQQRASVVPRWNPPLDSGALVRVIGREGRVTEGRLLSRSPDTLLLRRTAASGVAGSDTLIRARDVDFALVSVKQRGGRRGAAIGAGIGAGLGMLVGIVGCATYSGPSNENFCGLGFIFGVPMLSAAGGAVGYVAGRRTLVDGWELSRPAP